MADPDPRTGAVEPALPMADLDPDAVVRLAYEAIGILNASHEAALMDDLDSRLFRNASACEEDHLEVLTLIEDLQKEVSSAEMALQEALKRNDADAPVEALRSDLEALLHRERLLRQEERSIQNHLDALDEQRQSLQAQKESLKRTETQLRRNQNVLALCASLFHIIPSFEGTNTVAGNLVDTKGRAIETFELSTEHMSEFDICNKLWKMGPNV